jgi:hypothetical protein
MHGLLGRGQASESGISIALLTVIFLIGAGLLVKQSCYDPARFGAEITSPAESIGKDKAASAAEPALLLPAGYATVTALEHYEPDSLYEKIDGKAELYLSCGFRLLNCQRFAAADNEEHWAEIYLFDMGTARNAFAVYSTQKRAEALPLEGIQFGYRTQDAVFVAAGRYYLEVVAGESSPQMVEAMVQVAVNFAGQAETAGSEIGELKLLASDYLVPDSFGLQLVNAFGLEELGNIFSARYAFGNEVVTVFIGKQSDEAAAKVAAQRYYKFLVDNGAVDKTSEFGAPEVNGHILEFYGSTEVVFTNGVYLAGVHQAERPESAIKAATILDRNLSGASGK